MKEKLRGKRERAAASAKLVTSEGGARQESEVTTLTLATNQQRYPHRFGGVHHSTNYYYTTNLSISKEAVIEALRCGHNLGSLAHSPAPPPPQYPSYPTWFDPRYMHQGYAGHPFTPPATPANQSLITNIARGHTQSEEECTSSDDDAVLSNYSTKKRSRARGNTTKAKNARKKAKKPAKGRKKKAKARRKETINGKDLWDTSNMIKGANVNGLKREYSKGKDDDDESHYSLTVIESKTTGRTRAITEKNKANMRQPLEIDKSSGGDDDMSSENENDRKVSGCTTTAPNAKESETQQQGQCEKAESEIELSEELKHKNDSGESGRENKEVTENTKEEEQEGNNDAAVANNNNDECDDGSEGESVAKLRMGLKWV